MASSNIMINPAASPTTMKGYELQISKLYLHHEFREPTLPTPPTQPAAPPTQPPIQPTVMPIVNLPLPTDRTSGHQGFGSIAAMNWTIYDGPDPAASNVVASAQGTHASDGRHVCFTLVFEIDWLKSSTLLVMGVDVLEGQWGIVGGTGYFNMAQGYINKRNHKKVDSGNIVELEVYAIFGATKLQFANPYRVGVKDVLNDIERGRDVQEPKHDPWRLERIRLNHGDCIISFEYSYIDKDGVKRTDGPWGDKPFLKFDQIDFGPSEVLTEISGTVGETERYTVVTSLKFVTNVKTYGPYGRERGKPFSLPQKKNGTIVGFYGKTGGFIDQIGVIVRPWRFR